MEAENDCASNFTSVLTYIKQNKQHLNGQPRNKKQRKKIQNIPEFNSDDKKRATTLTNSPLQTLGKIIN
jgi:hypothetical protein